MAIVDPMHNLFLGTAKHILKGVWIDKGLITENFFFMSSNRELILVRYLLS
jgi:hypothetical protein